MRPNHLKDLWQSGKPALNGWLTIPSAWSAELLAHTGFDALTLDLQHGLIDTQTALAMLQAISTTTVVPLVRVAWNEPAHIMRMLDAGAYGVICPMVNSRAEADAFVAACRYPPDGMRSWGPLRARVYAGEDYVANANHTILAFAMIETAQALEQVDEIAATPGLDGIYVGTIDLSLSLGLPEQVDLAHPAVRAALGTILKAVEANRIAAGIHVNTPEEVKVVAELGFRLITVATDGTVLERGARQALEAGRQAVSVP